MTWHITNVERAQDATHGFALPEYNINLSIEPGETVTFEFDADKSGVLTWYCSEFCSALHLEMAGYMMTAPPGTAASRRARGVRGARIGAGLMKGRFLLIAAAACFAAAVAFPFWKMTLVAPQYPDGLRVTVGVFGLAGDVREINGLNHYIGMAPLQSAAKFEIFIAPWGMVFFILISPPSRLSTRGGGSTGRCWSRRAFRSSSWRT